MFQSGLRHDLRSAWRSLRHSRAFAAWVVGSLAIGMAVTIAAVALLNAALVLPFPGITDQPRLARVTVSENCGRPDCWRRMMSPADYETLQDGLPSVEGLAAYAFGEVNAAVPDARFMRAVAASPNYFEVLGVRAAAGRLFDKNDAAATAAVAVLAHGTWTREFGADPGVVGRPVRIDERVVQVVGVAPPFFHGVDRVRPGSPRSMTPERGPDIWLPLWLSDRLLPSAVETPSEGRSIFFVGRLRPGASIETAQVEAAVVAHRLAATRSDQAVTARAEVRQLWKVNPANWRIGLIVIFPIPLLVLLIACVNAANLMTARGSQRQREIAIRLAIGAGRGRIIRQLLIESAVLALGATAVALPIAWCALQLARAPLGIPIPFDATVLGLTLLTAALTTLVFGLAPAVRISAQQPSSTLAATGIRGDEAPRRSRARQVLVMAQVALSLALLATAWQLVSTVRGDAVSAGTAARHLLLARFDLRPLGLGAEDGAAFYRELVSGARRLPGVEAVGIARHTSVWGFGQAAQSHVTVWRDADRPKDGQTISGGYAGGDLFAAVGLRIVAGRDFTDADRQVRPQVAIVNETAAKAMTGPAVGGLLHIAPTGKHFDAALSVRVIGVVEASREPRLESGEPPRARVYLPSPIEPEPALAVYVRTRDDATSAAQPLRELAARIGPRVPILEIGSLEEFNERSYATQLWLARAAGLIGIIGVLLATAGLYSVASYVVAMRSREIAIRMAIGARPQAILTMILGQSARIALIGLVVGSGLALAASRLIQSEYHGVRSVDTAAFAAAVALFLTAMLVASGVPALRAARVNPIENLKDS